MQGVLFRAGLGDVIRSIYLARSYKFISETRVPVKVLCASHNPFALEIFRHHRNARNFVLYDLGHKFEEFASAGLHGGDLDRALWEFAQVEAKDRVGGKLEEEYAPMFDAPDDMGSTGHVVFQPFTGSVSSRVMPAALMEGIAKVLRKLPCEVYLVTRSYPRKNASGRTIHADEDARRFAGENITVLEHLSVPATLNLVKHCRAYVGGWSSMHQAAWFEQKPVAVLHPPNWCDVVNRTGYAFGLDRENTWHRDWNAADMKELAAWFERWF
jgi:hypothetical protein